MADENLKMVPPHNYEAESAVLGSILIDKDALFKIADQLHADDFYKDVHGHIYDAMLHLFS